MKLFHRIPKQFRYPVIAALTAVAIVVVGLILKFTVLKISASSRVSSADALNDTRSPIAEELSQQPKVAPPMPAPTPTMSGPTVAIAPGTTDGITPAGGSSSSSVSSSSATASTAGIATSGAAVEMALDSAKENFGHLPYSESDPARLKSVGTFSRDGYDRTELLDEEAAQAFMAMQSAAAAQGIKLMPVSGFRSVNEQKSLFENQIERKGGIEAAAQYSAPPGHSEHHTGYAVDVADGDYPEADLKHSFEDTAAYRWMLANAQTYQFEESFPKDNQQGVSFEPWHWRYVGSARAGQTFATARTLYPSR
jgi:zinc D-Ala-D-Ala carboxypeptidase